MEQIRFSAIVFRFLTLRLTTRAQAVLNAPVSTALLPNALDRKGSPQCGAGAELPCVAPETRGGTGAGQGKTAQSLSRPQTRLLWGFFFETLSESKWQVVILY